MDRAVRDDEPLGDGGVAQPLGHRREAFLGHPWPSGPAWLLPATALTVVATACLTIELPTRQALRTPPAAAIRAS